MDLTQAHDHPAALLRHQRHCRTGAAAEILRDYESDKGVTFAALDNGALEDVTKAYETLRLAEQGWVNGIFPAARDLLDALDALLGLRDA
jgi:hypothetical protein